MQQAIKISLVRSHSCAFVFQTFFLIEITFSVIMPFSEVHLRILFPLFAVLEKHGAAPWSHMGIKLGATFVCLNGVSLFLLCCESTVPSVLYYCWRRWGRLGEGGESFCTVQPIFSWNAEKCCEMLWNDHRLRNFLLILCFLFLGEMVKSNYRLISPLICVKVLVAFYGVKLFLPFVFYLEYTELAKGWTDLRLLFFLSSSLLLWDGP